ncbi:3-phosphoserine/phosphohydroxythreonine transaminase, partial [Tepidimonas thermarum]|uniref:3-phosphoserine/phosphohydroxythreonine transaminase n=1 Tax=Tepidimonas thermarum TaxID=335431 RepID=UPI00117C4BF9
MARPYNFSAGPATMPESVLRQAAAEMLDWHGCGMGVMEMSHRGAAFGEILEQAQADLRALLAIPPHFHVLFSQGGALAHNAIVPLNLAGRHPERAMDFVVTGGWSQKSAREAQRYGDVHIAASSADEGFVCIPPPQQWRLRERPAYVHLCSNETIHGVEFHTLPDLAALGCDAPLVIDFSSHVLSRPIDWDRVGLAFGGAQKNIGPAGLTLVIVREDLLGHALPICPTVFDYRTLAEQHSMANTPPTWAIYVAGLVFRWAA